VVGEERGKGTGASPDYADASLGLLPDAISRDAVRRSPEPIKRGHTTTLLRFLEASLPNSTPPKVIASLCLIAL